MITINTRPSALQRGLSLVELMVGLTIGVIAVLLMAQMAINYDRQKRGSAGSADAMNTGAIALYSIESDIKQAGYGLSSLDSLYCSFLASGALNGRRYMPVMIIPDGMPRTHANNPLGIPPGDAGSDAIAVMYTDTVSTAEGVPISASTNTTYSFAKNVTGFNVGDFVVAAQAGQPCTIAQITAVANPTITVDHSSAGATYAVGAAHVFNVGVNGMTMRVYAVRNGNLTVCNFWSSNCATDLAGLTSAQVEALWVPIASNVAALRAQYGWDTSATADMRVEAYCRSRLTTAAASCPATDDGITPPATVPSTACDWTRIASVRVALVTRSAERAPDNINVTDATIALWPSVSGAAVSGTTPLPTTSAPVLAVGNRQYRYKVFNTISPIRNVIWLGAQSSCT